VDILEFIPLTHAEERIYLTQKLNPNSSLWNVPISRRYTLVDLEILKRAVQLAAKHTQGLHVVFTEKNGVPGKYLRHDFEPNIQQKDFSTLGEQCFLEWAQQNASTLQSMLDEQPYQIVIADVGNATAYLYTNYHHIAADGGASNLFFDRVMHVYRALENGTKINLPEEPALRTAYDSEQKYLNSEQFQNDKQYWDNTFLNVPEPMDIAGRPAVKSLKLSKHKHRFSSMTTQRLLEFCSSLKVSPFRVVLAAMAMVFYRTLRREEVVIGTATANRHPLSLNDTLGMYVNTSALKIHIPVDASFTDVVSISSTIVKEAISHERYPYDVMTSDIRKRTGDVPNLLDCTLVELVRTPSNENGEPCYHHQGDSLISIAGFLGYPHRNAPAGMPIDLDFVYNKELFEPWRIRELVIHIENIINAGIDNPDVKVHDVDFICREEQRRIVENFNTAKGDWDTEVTLHGCFSNIVKRFPGHTAVVYRGQKLTYAELDCRSNALARTLIKNGAKNGTVVGLLADRSLDIIVAQLAILKSGAAFMPIDADYPDSRIKFMLDDIDAPIIVTQNRFIAERDFNRAQVVNLDNVNSFDPNSSTVENSSTPDDLCAVIYTSGSTGNPKGVLLEHRSLCNSINFTIHDQNLGPEDRISKYASFSFDASMWEVFASLLCGGQLHIIPEEIRLSLGQLNEYFETNAITWAFLTTQFGEQFVEYCDNKSLKTLVIGGEKLRTFKQRNYQLINAYGPTECAIYVTEYAVDQFEDNIPIGTTIPNCRIYILDNSDKPQPVGYAGELCIAGVGVGRGYNNLEEKTAECFVADIFYPNEMMYRTGDLACWTPDGTILHLGRIDRQVKLRGFRIELGEIENALLSIDKVTEAAVADFKDSDGHVYLCGYFCGGEDIDLIKSQLKSALPSFMVPAHLVQLDAMPINPSGKIDRKKLPLPEQSSPATEEYVAPEGELEQLLVQAWGEALDRENISVTADFFHSGGDSLQSVALQIIIAKLLHQDVDLTAIFEHSTPKAMAEHIKQSSTEERSVLTVAPPADFYPTTVSQQQLYLLSQMKGIGTAYNMPICISFEGDLDPKRLSKSLLDLVDRHESLRTFFEVREGKCVQIVADNVHVKLDRAVSSSSDPEIFSAGFVKPFDLSRAPLMQTKLISHTSKQHWLLLDFHHIAFDGVSVAIFLRELMALYRNETLPELPIQQKDFSTWESGRIDELRLKHESFWFDLFADLTPGDFPTEFQRSGAQSFDGASLTHHLDPQITSGLRTLAQQNGATLHQVFMSAIGVLTGRWSDSEDVCIGTSMSGRERAETAGVIGMFVRTLPTRIRLEFGKTFAELLGEIKKQMRLIHEHSEYPINGLYEHLRANRGPGRHPLFDINFVMRNTGAEYSFEAENIIGKVSPLAINTAKFDISFSAEEVDNGIAIEVDYRTSLFSRATISRMTGHLCRILQSIVAQPDLPIGNIDMVGPEERDALLVRFNPQPTPAPAWATVCQAISAHAVKNPDKIAVVAEGETLSYQELDQRANRVARAIHSCGGGPDKIIAVIADRSIWSIVGILAALKSGSAYVGLDIHYPADRIQFIIDDTNTPCIVGTTAQLSSLDTTRETIALDGSLPEDSTDPLLAQGGRDLAYCIFTSGSTGSPKGVLIEHNAMVNFIGWYVDHHKILPESGCAAFAAFSFDVSVVQIFAPLVAGATLHVVPEELRRLPLDLDEYFCNQGVTHAHFPTQFAEQFIRMCDSKSLQSMVVGGDKLTSYQLRNYRLTNEYGPSETAMACLSYDVQTVMAKPPIGTPVANTRVYILDSSNRLCPIGMPGEICVAGAGVGRGYLNRPELTAKSFVDDPFVPGERMFRTGDKGRLLADGTVDFIGRIDFQVKIRGYRIEPGEIESFLQKYEHVLESVIVPLDDLGGGKVLAAYYTATQAIDPQLLKSYLKETLPEYMVPSYLVQLDKMILSPNGKIDRGKLPRPELSSSSPLEPRNAKETSIAIAWEKVLGHKGFGLFDSFYDIGGDSLDAITLMAELSELFDISGSDIFAYTTIAEQAAHFQEAQSGRSTRLLQLKQLTEPVEKDDLCAVQQQAYAAACQQDVALDTCTLSLFDHVLLTGATGTLGIYLLRELLEQCNCRVTVIARADNDLAAQTRLEEHYFERFAKPLEAEGKRLEIISGNLSANNLGLDFDTYQLLSTSVDTILNSAALTSHYGDWDDFKTANITSVENLAEFAQNGRPKTFHHVSTTSIGAGQINGRSENLFTEFDIDMGQSCSNLYIRSKLESEILLGKLKEQGLPINVYRAGNITCDSKTGALQRNVEDNAFYQQLRAYVNLGVAPETHDCRNMTFVDQSAQAIVTLMRRSGLVGQTFHIQNPQLLSLSKALQDDKLGLRLSCLSFHDFIDFFAAHAGCNGFNEYVERLLLHLGWQDWLADPSQTATSIQVERTVALLERCGFTWKVPESSDLRLFVNHALRDRVQNLKNIPGFELIEDGALTDIAARIKPEYFSSDTLLQQESKTVKGLRFVIDGMVETYRHNANGWIGTVRVAGPGACVGEEAVTNSGAAINSVEAIDDTFAFHFELEDMHQLMVKHPQLALALLKISSNKIDQTERLFVAV